MLNKLSKLQAVDFLDIPQKYFENYLKFSGEIQGKKVGGKWQFDKDYLKRWNDLRIDRTVKLNSSEYEKCFEFAIKMVYGGLSLHGIRGERTEVQAADDVILGILAELAIQKFLKKKFAFEILLDEVVHPKKITPQDIDFVRFKGVKRKPKLRIGIKASKMKSAFLVLGENEVELAERTSDVYIFSRVGLPSDHLFRILRDHSFFGKVRKFLEGHDKFKKINVLDEVPIWICGFTYLKELDKRKKIPGQVFSGSRYVKSVGLLRNSDDEWGALLKKL